MANLKYFFAFSRLKGFKVTDETKAAKRLPGCHHKHTGSHSMAAVAFRISRGGNRNYKHS